MKGIRIKLLQTIPYHYTTMLILICTKSNSILKTLQQQNLISDISYDIN